VVTLAPEKRCPYSVPLQQCTGTIIWGGLAAKRRVCCGPCALALFVCFLRGALRENHGLNALPLLPLSGGGTVERARGPSAGCSRGKFLRGCCCWRPRRQPSSSFQPSSATPTSWLTHFCSEVTGFLANFQREVLTPNVLSVPHPPQRGPGCANCEHLAY